MSMHFRAKNKLRRFAAFALTAALISGATLAVSPATAMNEADLAPAGTETFSVIGNLPVSADGTVLVQDLTKVGVTSTQVQSIQRGTLEPVDEQMAAAAAWEPFDRLTSWKDSIGLTVPIRYGTASWGYRHIVDKHNMTTNVSRTVTKYPRTRVEQSSSSHVYIAPVYLLNCSPIMCTILDQRDVRAVTNPTIQNDGHRRGIITTYCIGETYCNSWVKNSVNAN